MTGKEFIIYILENDLVDKPIFEDDKIAGLLTVTEAAAKLNVGKATMITYAAMALVDIVEFRGIIFIIDNDKLTKGVTA